MTAPAVKNSYGSRARMTEYPKSQYSEWRRTVGRGCYANDIDFVEWRTGGASGIPQLVAVTETTVYPELPGQALWDYCDAILDRYKRDGQYGFVMRCAEKFGVPAYLVLHRCDMAFFVVCRLSDELWTKELTEQQYREWIWRLGEGNK